MGNNESCQRKEQPKIIEQQQNQSSNINNAQRQIANPSIHENKQIKSNLSTHLQKRQTTQISLTQDKKNIQSLYSNTKAKMNSSIKQCFLTCSSMIMTNSLTEINKQANKISVKAPFSVIFLACSQQLKESMIILGHQIISKYKNIPNNDSSPWKLHSKGFYINQIAQDVTSILTFDKFFQGNLIEVEGTFLPSGNGIFINEYGLYKGQFLKGKAHGKGIFIDRIQKTHFEGYWTNGQLQKGKINNSNYIFAGFFVENKANGVCEISFKENKTYYKGGFKDGLYNTTGFGKACYSSQNYIYQGQFLNGKKHNLGVLIEKQHIYKDKREKYHPPEQLEGVWEKDYFIQQKKIDQKVKKNNSKNIEESFEKFLKKIMEAKSRNAQKSSYHQQSSVLKQTKKQVTIDIANIQDAKKVIIQN